MAGTEKNYDGNPHTRQLSHSLEQGLHLNQFTFLILNASDPFSRLQVMWTQASPTRFLSRCQSPIAATSPPSPLPPPFRHFAASIRRRRSLPSLPLLSIFMSSRSNPSCPAQSCEPAAQSSIPCCKFETDFEKIMPHIFVRVSRLLRKPLDLLNTIDS